VSKLLGMNLPASGGGYFRLYPGWLSSWLLSRVNGSGIPFVFYVHPWEIDPDQPRMRAGIRTRFRHYVNLRSTECKLDQLLRRFRFGTLTESLSQFQSARPAEDWKIVR